jgi:hypothetical protein
MRLINIHTRMLEEFFENNTPPYCILSHRWTDSEVSCKMYVKAIKKHMRGHELRLGGYRKVFDFCELVEDRVANGHLPRRRRYHSELGEIDEDIRHVWIDTVCIDKNSSAELSEAINSMYKWYTKAQECYVYLADVHISDIRIGRKSTSVELNNFVRPNFRHSD